MVLKDPRRGRSIHIPGIPSHNSTTRPGDTGSAPATAKDTTAEDIMNLERRTDTRDPERRKRIARIEGARKPTPPQDFEDIEQSI